MVPTPVSAMAPQSTFLTAKRPVHCFWTGMAMLALAGYPQRPWSCSCLLFIRLFNARAQNPFQGAREFSQSLRWLLRSQGSHVGGKETNRNVRRLLRRVPEMSLCSLLHLPCVLSPSFPTDVYGRSVPCQVLVCARALTCPEQCASTRSHHGPSAWDAWESHGGKT